MYGLNRISNWGVAGAGLTIGIEVGSMLLIERSEKRSSFKTNVLCTCSGMEVAANRLAKKSPGYADTYSPREVEDIANNYWHCAQYALSTKKVPKYLKEVWPRYVKTVKTLENQLKRHLSSFEGFVPELSS